MRLIDADAFIRYIDPGHLRSQHDVCFSESDVVEMIRKQPTIEAAPVKHGQWSEEENEVWYCLECDTWLYVDSGTADMNYCPNCGTKMYY
jgi:hypothetical protein